jgi:hypothetical protein
MLGHCLDQALTDSIVAWTVHSGGPSRPFTFPQSTLGIWHRGTERTQVKTNIVITL